ncbi:hypothetical protein GH714_034211 [Hevea brasiliensis]|uniref:Uncharacterized protein n=1 Tax=Hevea brasiliensis TaxID=3981 RepID=A0A6A6L5A0_HEVBR|nr:hypothetical protein GH714_034211 [Hevea brasiliensis]
MENTQILDFLLPYKISLLMVDGRLLRSIPDKDVLGLIGSETTDLPENEFLDLVLAKDIATVPLFVSIMDSTSSDSSFLGGIASSKIQLSGWAICSSVLWIPIELNLSRSIPDKDVLGLIGSETTDLPENEFLDLVLAKDIATVPLFVSIMDSTSSDSSFLGGIASSKIQLSVPNLRENTTKLITPKGTTTFFVTDLQKGNLVVPKSIAWEQVNLPDSWILEEAIPPKKEESEDVESIIETNNGTVAISFARTRSRNSFSGRSVVSEPIRPRTSLSGIDLDRFSSIGIHRTEEQIAQPIYGPESTVASPIETVSLKRPESPTPSDMGYEKEALGPSNLKGLWP